LRDREGLKSGSKGDGVKGGMDEREKKGKRERLLFNLKM
jgi:hypothetical protein